MSCQNNTHSVLMGYVLWIFGFTGSHRFYYGKKLTGTLWLFTGGLLLIGWFVDLFLIPSMDREADIRYVEGPNNYNVAWVLLTFVGYLGIHHFYLGKWGRGLIYLATLGVFGLGVIYDFFNLNEIVSEANQKSDPRRIADAF